MIMGLSLASFCILMICAFFAGAIGALVVLYGYRKLTKHKAEENLPVNRTWSDMTRDEQLYNGR